MRRAREYLPVEDERNPHARRPLGRQYIEFVTREVIPFVERNYPGRRGARRDGRFGGSSYGAAAALLTVLERPGVFGRLLLESPSLYVGRPHPAPQGAARAPLAGAGLSRGGDGRDVAGRGQPRDGRERAHARVDPAELRGLGAKRLKVVVEQGARHTEGAWAGRLPEALAFLFGR